MQEPKAGRRREIVRRSGNSPCAAPDPPSQEDLRGRPSDDVPHLAQPGQTGGDVSHVLGRRIQKHVPAIAACP